MDLMIIYQWILKRIENNTYNDISGNSFEFINNLLKEQLNNAFAVDRKKPLNYLTKRYTSYFKKDVFKRNKGITTFSLESLKPSFESALRKSIANSIQLITFRHEQAKKEVERRFFNFINFGLQKDTSLNDLKSALNINQSKAMNEKHIKSILTDQTHKLNANIDRIIAEKNKAIGCVWHTQEDIKVVGNPSGKYPKVTDVNMHGNHYKRNNIFYVYPKAWAYQRGLIKGDNYESLKDGGVSSAINCRCYLENIYDLRDVPEGHLTKKGIDYINLH